MAAPQRLTELPERFYVPSFTVTVAGTELPDPVVRDVLEVKYTDNVEEIDSFELTLSNWDAERFKPKYEPPSTDAHKGLFDPGKELTLSLGYQGSEQLMLAGVITTLEGGFTASGLTLSVRGLNALHKFRTEQHTYAWENTTDSKIAEELGSKPVAKGKPGLGIKVKTAPKDEPQEAYVFMDNQFDIVFLLQRARRRGYELVLQQGDTPGEQVLYFGPSENRGEPPAPYILEWGRSLVSFRPTLSTATQIGTVKVRGWDRRTNKPIEGTASWEGEVKDSQEKARLKNFSSAFGNRTEVITDRPVHSKKEAEELAKRILQDKLKTMVTATGSVVGLPDLRAGRKVQIVGLGERYSGEYFLTETTHSLGENGYTTEFKARREGPPQGVAP